MVPRSLFGLLALVLLPGILCAETAAPRPPIVNDTALKIELLATLPGVEACTTVCGAPDGSFYVGNDARDGRLATSDPVNQIVRFSSMGADKKRTVFADKIYSPAGSAWHDGYLYVLHDPLLTRFRDTDGDGIADVREDLITNLGIPPNEGLNDHVVSGFTLGMDGFFYISVGDRGIFGAKSVKDGSTITMRGGGIIRCRPDGTQLEIFSTGTRNHLEVNLDAEDNAFTRDNTDDGNGWWTRLTHHIQGGYYGYPYDFRSAPNYGVVQPSQQTLDAIKQHGGAATVDSGLLMVDGRTVPPVVESQKPPASPSASGLSTINSQPSTFLPAMADFGGGSPTGGLCYLSDGLPEQYRGKHFFSEWGKAGIFVTEVARDGATFRLVSDTKLVEPEKGGDFRPMQLSVAADGSLLIADWGYGGWKSPRVAGAVWRLSWPEAKIAPRLKDESKATLEELLAALGHPDRDQRLRAEAALLSGRVGVSPAGLGVPPKRTSDRADNATSPSTAPSSVSGTPKDRPGGTPEPAGGTPTLPGRLAAIVQDENAPTVQRIHALWTLARLALPDQTPAAAGAPSLQAATAAGTPPLQTPTAVGAPSLQPGGLADISRGSSEATTPGNATPGIRPGGAAEGNVAGSGSSAPAGAGAGVDGKPRVSPGANLLQPSGLAELLRDKNSAVRLQAARVIGTTFNFNTPENTRIEADQATSPALIRALGDSDPAVRRATLAALARVPNPSPAVGAPIVAALLDSDQWVRFTARGAARIHGWEAMDRVLAGTDDQAKDAVWQALDRAAGNDQALQVVLLRESKSSAASTRARAVAALGKIAYQPAPYDGHWWGTQPVKSPPPLNSVPWAGTPAALAALTAALADADARVRLAAAKAFTQFVMPTAASVSPARAGGSFRSCSEIVGARHHFTRSKTVIGSLAPGDGFLHPCRRRFRPLSASFLAAVDGFFHPCERLFHPLPASPCPPVSGFLRSCQRLHPPLSGPFCRLSASFSPPVNR